VIPWRVSDDVQCALRGRAEEAVAEPAVPSGWLSPPPRCLGCRRLPPPCHQSRPPPSFPHVRNRAGGPTVARRIGGGGQGARDGVERSGEDGGGKPASAWASAWASG
jgi:hypothetical protein